MRFLTIRDIELAEASHQCRRDRPSRSLIPALLLVAVLALSQTAILPGAAAAGPARAGFDTTAAGATYAQSIVTNHQPAPSLTAVVTVPRLNVRAGPGLTFKVIGQVKAGDTLTVTGRNVDNSWVQITKPLAGWVSARYINLAGSMDDLPVPALVPASRPVIDQPTTVRSTPSGLAGHIVFQDKSGGTIYVYTPSSGELRPLTGGAHPAISPDGTRVAFVRGGGDSGLWVIHIDGTNPYKIYATDTARTPAWSPDGQWIVFSRTTGYDTCRDLGPDGYQGRFGCVPDRPGLEDFPLVTTPIRTLSRVDTNGSNERDIASLQRAQAPSWSGTEIVYQDSSPAGLQITADHPDAASRPLLAGFLNQDPAWQPGGGRIAYQTEVNGKWQIFTINPDGSGRVALTGAQSAAGGAGSHHVSPSWSPDGKRLLFVSDRGGRWALWVMNADGSNPQPLPISVPIEYGFNLEQVASWGA